MNTFQEKGRFKSLNSSHMHACIPKELLVAVIVPRVSTGCEEIASPN